ncbi:MAG: hypothetical protein IKG72_10415 [Bacillus sp. (in: Bacteria)]|nr:hypothetical protein [Bacillus sp. (in: firmicutes)]
MQIVVISVMTVVFGMVLLFYRKVARATNGEMFFVVGRWIPGLFGMIFAIGSSIVAYKMSLPILIPVGLFVFSFIWGFLNLSPILKVTADSIQCTCFGGSLVFRKEDAEYTEFKNGILIEVGERKVFIRNDSVNSFLFRIFLEN